MKRRKQHFQEFFFLFALFIKNFSPWNCFILAIVGRKGWIMSSLASQGFCNHADYIKSVLLAESFTFRFVKEFLSSTYRTAALTFWNIHHSGRNVKNEADVVKIKMLRWRFRILTTVQSCCTTKRGGESQTDTWAVKLHGRGFHFPLCFPPPKGKKTKKHHQLDWKSKQYEDAAVELYASSSDGRLQ